MNIKKAYVEIIALLEANSKKKVSTILEEAKLLCESKNAGGSELGSTFVKNDEGETIAIFCYYFKAWMSPSEVEFGHKANTASGYNTMCKEGVRNWTKQQRVAKTDKEKLLQLIADEELAVEDLAGELLTVETNRKLIQPAEEPLLHFSTYAELEESDIDNDGGYSEEATQTAYQDID